MDAYMVKIADWPTCYGNFNNYHELQRELNYYQNKEVLKEAKKHFIELKNNPSKAKINKSVLDGFALASRNTKASINVLDVGGSIGTAYYACLHTYGPRINRWEICERSPIVSMLNDMSDEKVLYISNIGDSSSEIDLAVISGTLQYTNDPFGLIQDIVNRKPYYIVIVNTPFYENKTRLTIQLSWKKEEGYSTRNRYPSWIINEDDMMQMLLKKGYEKIDAFDSLHQTIYIQKYGWLRYQGFCLKKMVHKVASSHL